LTDSPILAGAAGGHDEQQVAHEPMQIVAHVQVASGVVEPDAGGLKLLFQLQPVEHGAGVPIHGREDQHVEGRGAGLSVAAARVLQVPAEAPR
jgi:hypothetical protein